MVGPDTIRACLIHSQLSLPRLRARPQRGWGSAKLTSPTFEYLGFKLRDTIRSWMSSKVKERAALRRAEVGFLYRQLDLLDYGNDQYAAYLESMTKVMLDRHFDVITPLAKQVVAERKIPPERSMEILHAGLQSALRGFGGPGPAAGAAEA